MVVAAASTPLLSFFLQAGCPTCRPTNSVIAQKAKVSKKVNIIYKRGQWSAKAESEVQQT